MCLICELLLVPVHTKCFYECIFNVLFVAVVVVGCGGGGTEV
jgi:hypothetical protein